ncbi:MAG: hypothetical protein AUJ52_14895 [Elusimicrobia bacterium CG1_02_63_36]|nr:MAG: hypothetical protein AUJ52_14895 [Elusimicrobia bacterium CG1_02_63_36]
MGEGLAEFLKKKRTELGYSLKDAAKSTGIQEAYIWQLENGKRKQPRPDTLKQLAKGYGVPLETLFNCAGYTEAPADPKKEAEAETKLMFRDYEKLPEDKKKLFQILLKGLKSDK